MSKTQDPLKFSLVLTAAIAMGAAMSNISRADSLSDSITLDIGYTSDTSAYPTELTLGSDGEYYEYDSSVIVTPTSNDYLVLSGNVDPPSIEPFDIEIQVPDLGPFQVTLDNTGTTDETFSDLSLQLLSDRSGGANLDSTLPSGMEGLPLNFDIQFIPLDGGPGLRAWRQGGSDQHATASNRAGRDAPAWPHGRRAIARARSLPPAVDSQFAAGLIAWADSLLSRFTR